MKKLLISAAIVAGAAFGINGQANAACGEFQMSDMNWPSATLMANVDKIILEEGYGCKIELIPGATTATFATMNEKGMPNVAAELWTNAVSVELEKAMSEGRLHSAVKGPITELGEGWWVTPGTLKRHPEFKTVLDILERPDLFPDKEDPSKGAFIGCPAGWGCQLSNQQLFKGFDMEKKGWVLVDPGSQAGLDASMAKAAQRDQNWLGYYWSPTAAAGKYEMQLMDFGVPFAGHDHWNNCIAVGPEKCADPKASAWTESVVQTVVTPEIKAMPDVMTYFGNRIYPGAIMNGMLVYMEDNQATGPDAALEFLDKHADIWTKWVSADVAAKVKKSL